MPVEYPYPIPKPKRRPAAIYRTGRQGLSTLQDQMGLGDDLDTFSELVNLFRQTAASRIDMNIAYQWQDPRLLQVIREEVLVQWPVLEDMYVNAWPITYYLKRALKNRGRRVAQPKHIARCGNAASKRSHPTTKRGALAEQASMPSKIPSRSKATSNNLASRKLVDVTETSLRYTLRRSNRMKKLSGNEVIGIGDLSEHNNDNEDEELEDKEGEMSSEHFHKAWDFDRDGAGSGSDSITERSQPLCFSYESPDSDREPTREDNFQPGAHKGLPSRFRPSVRYRSRRRARIPPPNVDHSGASPSPNADPDGMDDASPGTEHPAAPCVLASSSSALEKSTPLFSEIEDMLLSRGLPPVDARRIILLLSSLGIVDRTYLRVFAHLARPREAWLSRMHQEGQLSKIQAWVVVDMLESVMMD